MASIKTFLVKYKAVIFIAIFLVLITIPLRFINLGYSDYHGDEFKSFLVPASNENTWQFLVRQRKGPVQFLLSSIPHAFTHDFKNEFAQRFPFALSATLSVVFFFLFILNVTKSKAATFFSSVLFLTNGFVSGFGRISQYQNLNLLFSFAALWMYSYLSEVPLSDKKSIKYALLGTTFWALSILSHWDAILISPFVIVFFLKSFILSKSEKKKVLIRVLQCLVLGLVITLPFMVPYIDRFQDMTNNQDYASRRVGMDLGYSKLPLYKSLTELYNPFLNLPLLVAFGVVGAIFFKKSYPFLVWFAFVFGFFEIFVRNPGTHFYNFLLPLIILAGIGMGSLFNLHKITKIIFIVPILLVLSFLYYQTYILYVDHNQEYPFKDKVVLKIPFSPAKSGYLLNLVAKGIEDPKPLYMRGSYIPLFGFTHSRFWNEVNDYVETQNKLLNQKYKYITNEDKAISDRYMDTKYGLEGGYYAVGIKRPMNFVYDFRLTNYSNKKLVKTFELNGEPVVFIYKSDPTPKVFAK